MPLIRTTINPAVEILVSDEELLDLTRQGLIFDGPPPPAQPLAIKSRPVLSGNPDGSYDLTLERNS